MTYKDIITYELALGISEQELMHVAKQILDTWMSKQPGFLKWEIHSNLSGGYTDIVYWESKESAKKAEASMKDIPNADEWYKCYKTGSIKSVGLNLIGVFE